MVIIDENFNEKEFLMTECFFKEDFDKTDDNLKVHLQRYGGKICVVYIDIYGNEFKEVIKIK